MCTCVLSTKTSTLIKSAFSLSYELGRRDADAGKSYRPLTMRAAKRAVEVECRCKTARRARKFIARAFLMGFEAGYINLLGAEAAFRAVSADSSVVNIEALRSARVARETCEAPLVVGD